MGRWPMAGWSQPRAQRSFVIVAGARPSRSALSMYSSANAPKVAPTASFAATRSRRFAAAGSSPDTALTRASLRAFRAALSEMSGYLPRARFRSTPCDRYLSRHSLPPSRRNQQVEAPAVRQLLFPIPWLRGPYRRVGKRYTRLQRRPPERPPTVLATGEQRRMPRPDQGEIVKKTPLCRLMGVACEQVNGAPQGTKLGTQTTGQSP